MISIRFGASATLALAAVAGLCLAANPATASANLLSNGSFESPVGAVPYQDMSAGQSIGAWQITNGTVDLINGYWTSEDGNQSLDMSGVNAGTIAQTVNTTAGQEYQLSFWMAGNTDGGNTVKSLSSFENGTQIADSLFDDTGKSRTNMGWTEYSYDFTATQPATTISFQSNDQNPYGAALDNVSLQAVPEGSTIVLFSLLLVGGLLVMVRRRPTATVNA